MPRLDTYDDAMEQMKVPGPGTFTFSAVKPDELGASEYTLVTLVIDNTGSVYTFAEKLLETVKTIIKACKKSPRAENLMVRYITFNTKIEEIHGFKELHSIDPDTDYEELNPRSMTALFDACYSGIGSTLTYADTLTDQDFDVNGAVYIVTDGEDNNSSMGPGEIKKQLIEAMQGEKIESLVTVLVGLKDPSLTGDDWANYISKKLENFKDDAGLTQYVDVGDATEGKLAKLADFVSESISSQSNSLNSGSASVPIDVTF